MIKKIKALMFWLIVITLTSKAEEANPHFSDLCIQFGLGFGAGCFMSTMPPLIDHIEGADEGIKQLSADCPDYGLFNTGLGTGVGFGLYNWYNVGRVYSKKYFSSNKGRYIAVIPALWLLSRNWKNNA